MGAVGAVDFRGGAPRRRPAPQGNRGGREVGGGRADYAAAYAAHAAYAANAAAYAADAAYAAHAAYAAYAAAEKKKWRWLHATYRHARGPVGLVFDPAWWTGTAVSLARGIVADRAFDRMPYLADALQDAGCDCPELMAHLQADRGEWTLADWPLWNLLGIGEEF